MVKDNKTTHLWQGGMKVFVLIWLGQLVSYLGSGLTNFALDVWVYQQTGSVTQFALLVLCTTLPLLIISPIAGALVDRWSRRIVMIASDSSAGLSTLGIAFLLMTGQLKIWHIYLATAVSASASAFQWPAYTAATSLLVPKQHLGRANGISQLGPAIAQLISPILGGALLKTIQLQGVIMLDFTTFLFALVTLFLVRFPEPTATAVGKLRKGLSLKEITYGWTYISTRPGLLGLLVFFSAINFLVGMLNVLATPLVLSTTSPANLGIILSIGGIGMLLGSLVMSIRASSRQLYMKVIFIFMLLNGLSMILAGLPSSLPLLGIAAFLFFLGLPLINGSFHAIFQRKVSPNLQGRVFALSGAISGASLPLAYVVAGPLADQVFEPSMSPNGFLAGSIGQLIGVGPGRGIALMFIVMGVLAVLVTVAAYQYPRLQRVEYELPDAID